MQTITRITLLLLCAVTVARAEILTYSWTGSVKEYGQAFDLPATGIHVGSIVTGYFNFDSTADLTPAFPHPRVQWSALLAEMDIEGTRWEIPADVSTFWADYDDGARTWREYLLGCLGDEVTPFGPTMISDSTLWLSERRDPDNSHLPPFNLTAGQWNYGHDLYMVGSDPSDADIDRYFALDVKIESIQFVPKPGGVKPPGNHVPESVSTGMLLAGVMGMLIGLRKEK